MTLPIWLLIALPLAGAVVLLLGGRATNPWGHLLGCATVLASFAVEDFSLDRFRKLDGPAIRARAQAFADLVRFVPAQV